ncbi:MAG: alpha/beta hydrolase [Sediminibacterium sp.]|nr:alpha/beta hydrolase [Sediminibacterium sp.]
MKLKQQQLFMVMLACTLLVCSIAMAQIKPEIKNAPTSVQYQYIGSFDPNKMDKIVNAELEEFLTGSPMPFSNFKGKFAKAKYTVKLYKVIYKSVVPEMGNMPTRASGLVAIPETGLDSMPVVSYQHGTVFGKDQVPSVPEESMETKLMLAQFAAQGYIVIGADYFGMGISDLPNSYLIRGSSEQAAVDMLFAAKDVLAAQKIKSGPLFTHGWSQGGWTNMTFLRKLESLNIPVAAAATASAPIDAFATINRWVNNYQPIDAVYLPGCASNFLFATEFYEKMPGLVARAVRPEYYQLARDFYEFKIDWTSFRKQTPAKLQDYLRPEFMATGNLGMDAYWQMLERYQAYRWRCKTPLINYYGEKDEVVPIYIATLAEGFHGLFGTNTTRAVSAGPDADHRATYVYSVIHVKSFFDSFLTKKNK